MKLMRWMIFGVICALVPIAIRLSLNWLRLGELNITEVMLNGDLCIIVCVMCATAVGEVIGSPASMGVWKILVSGFSMMLVIVSACTYAYAGTPEAAASLMSHQDQMFEWSVTLFITGTICSACCIVLSEL